MSIALGTAIITALSTIGKGIAVAAGKFALIGPKVTAVATKLGASAKVAQALGTGTTIAANIGLQLGADKVVDSTIGKISPQAANLVKAAVDGSTLFHAFSSNSGRIDKLGKVFQNETQRMAGVKASGIIRDELKALGITAGVAAGAFGTAKVVKEVSNYVDRKKRERQMSQAQ